MLERYSISGKRVWVAGHRGMVGSALLRRLEREDCEVLVAPRSEVDLKVQSDTFDWIAAKRPQLVLLAAARVGGILENSIRPADFIYDNLMIEANVIHGSFLAGVEKLVFLGSSCIYPKLAPQPIREDSLLTGPLEPTNEWYAIAKIAGIKMCQAYRSQHGVDFISAMPTNLYGSGDNFDLNSCHALPALVRKAHEAKVAGASKLVVWGTGTPRREYLHTDDCADAVLLLAQRYSDAEHVNVGSGIDLSIEELAQLVARIVGFDGEVVYDTTKPDGTPRKLLAVDKMHALGWAPRIEFEDGIAATYRWFLAYHDFSMIEARVSPC